MRARASPGSCTEIGWTRLLTLHLGHTTAAVSTVTAAFMGGLGLGGALGGRIASRLSRRQALWTYALLELVVAVAALCDRGSLTLLTPVFAWAYGEDGAGPLFSTVRIASSFGVLLVPGVALGATFPMAVRVAVTSPTRPGGPAGRLYGANTAGAAIGSLAAGFVLIPILGLTGTTLTGMAASAVSIALALSFVRRDLTVAESEDATTKTRLKRQDARHNRSRPRAGRAAANVDGRDTERRRYGLAAAVLALTGFATFAHEVVWTRVLAMVVGPSIYAFAATLTSFITGLALGSFAGASLAERVRRPAVALALTLIATAVAGCVSVALVGGSLLEIGPGTLGRSATPAGIALPHLAIAFGLTFPIALGLGVAFPLSLELAGSRDAIPAQRLGVLYAVNTAAAVVGALVAGFIAISAVGLRTSLLVATTSLLLGAAVLVVSGRFSNRGRVAVLFPLAAVVAWMATSPAGIVSGWRPAATCIRGSCRPASIAVRRSQPARSCTTARARPARSRSKRSPAPARSRSTARSTPQRARDMLTQKLLAHLPLLLHPNPRQVGIVGLGSGVTLASALVHPVVSVDVVEISPEVVEASAYFADVNRRALDDPRTRLVRGDGRTHFSLTSRLYDVVISEPSNPWMAGVAALFTQEFFQRVRSRLATGGIFCQWAHTYDVSDADLRSIVATFRAVFPDGTMWLAGDGDLLLVGSTAPLEPRLEDISTAWQRPGVGEDLRTVGMREPFTLLSLFVGGSRETSRYGAGSALQTDDRTALEFSGPFAVFAGVPSNHAATLRGLLDGGQQPPAVARALTGATAAQWRDRGAMLMDADAADSRIATTRRPSTWTRPT